MEALGAEARGGGYSFVPCLGHFIIDLHPFQDGTLLEAEGEGDGDAAFTCKDYGVRTPASGAYSLPKTNDLGSLP